MPIWHDVYVAACGEAFPNYTLGIAHERSCPECQRTDEPEEGDDDTGTSEDGSDDAG